MQNRYVGDIGDYGKYALLKSIAETGLTLGVNWYLAPDERHNSDGKHISYLHKNNYMGYDEELCSVFERVSLYYLLGSNFLKGDFSICL